MVNSLYEIADYGGDQALIIRSWGDPCREAIASGHNYVVLNYARGWKGHDVSFLSGQSFERLAILADSPITGLNALSSIFGLKRISANCESREAVDFTRFKNLEDCWLSSLRNHESIFMCAALKHLGLSDFEDVDFSRLSNMKSLLGLTVKGGKLKALGGIEQCQSLRSLVLTGMINLRNFSALSRLEQLNSLRIESCNVKDISSLGKSNSIRSLSLIDLGLVRGFDAVGNMSSLEEIVISGTTNIENGDLSCLASLSSLKTVNIFNRKHYTHATNPLTKRLRKKVLGF